MTTCSVEGCERGFYGRALCKMHYQRLAKRGTTDLAVKALVVCTIEGCERPARARGRCKKHDAQWRRDIAKAAGPPQPTLAERFWRHVVRRPNGCWEWTGYITDKGYGSITLLGKYWAAHRFAYELLVGPIPDGLELDHTCHSKVAATCIGGRSCLHRRCVNPAHLEPVTQAENQRRGKWAAKTHCAQGHEFTPENTFRHRRHHKTQRVCRTCHLTRKQKANR